MEKEPNFEEAFAQFKPENFESEKFSLLDSEDRNEFGIDKPVFAIFRRELISISQRLVNREISKKDYRKLRQEIDNTIESLIVARSWLKLAEPLFVDSISEKSKEITTALLTKQFNFQKHEFGMD